MIISEKRLIQPDMETLLFRSTISLLIILLMMSMIQAQILEKSVISKQENSVVQLPVPNLHQAFTSLSIHPQRIAENWTIQTTASVYMKKSTYDGSIFSSSDLSGETKSAAQETQIDKKLLPQKNSVQFQDIIHKTAKQYDIEPAIIKAIIMAESSFNPKAESHRGARGLMQLMPRTAKYLGVRDSFDPAQNIDGGARYFKGLLDRFDSDIELALAAYNAGSRNVRRYGGVPPFKATKSYIKKVLEYYETYNVESAMSNKA